MPGSTAALRPEDVFDFTVIDELRPEIEQVNTKYGGVPYFFRPGYLTYSDYNIRHGGHGTRVVESLNRVFSKISGGGRYLEIGCVDVPILKFMAPKFDEIVLIEPNPYNREIAGLIIERMGLTHITILPNIIAVDGTFDLITAWECLEHVVSVDASIGAAQYANYWAAKRQFLEEIRIRLEPGGHLFWSVPVMTGWVFAAKYVAALAAGRRYSEIEWSDALLHLTGQTRKIDKWIPASSHLGFNQKQFASLVSEVFPATRVEKLIGRKNINEHLFGHCTNS
jgi:2-polyprenyl-3-methyl-5-hydroxy-6-metoxy-1,4-benzoquinol methylase